MRIQELATKMLEVIAVVVIKQPTILVHLVCNRSLQGSEYLIQEQDVKTKEVF